MFELGMKFLKNSKTLSTLLVF